MEQITWLYIIANKTQKRKKIVTCKALEKIYTDCQKNQIEYYIESADERDIFEPELVIYLWKNKGYKEYHAFILLAKFLKSL